MSNRKQHQPPPAIETVALAAIDPNPYRDLDAYPWIDRKIEQLMRSISDVGFWEGVIARPRGERFELAFGHHRIEAGRRLTLATVPLIIRPLSDKQMLTFMGRENGEDYGTDLLVMLNAWEGAVKFLSGGAPPKPLAVATLLGWTTRHRDGGRTMTDVAKACNAANMLISAGHMARSDLAGLSVSAAQRVLGAAAHNMEQLDAVHAHTNRRRAEIEAAKRQIGIAATYTIQDYRDGHIAIRDLRTELEINTHRLAGPGRVKPMPMFSVFGQNLCEAIDRMLATDAANVRIDEIVNALPHLELEEDHAVLRRLHLALDELCRRAQRAKRRTTPNKVVPLKVIPDATA